MPDIHLDDTKIPPAKEIEQVLRTQGAEAALKAFQQCAQEAQTNGDATSKQTFNQLKKTLQDDGALEIIALKWASDRSSDLFDGSKSVTRDDVKKALGPIKYADIKTGQDPDLDGDLVLGNAFNKHVDAKTGQDMTTLNKDIASDEEAFLGSGGGMKNEVVLAAKKLIDDGDHSNKLYQILKGNGGNTNGVTKDALVNFLAAAQAKDSTYLANLGYKPEEYAGVIAAVKTIKDHYSDFNNGGNFNGHDLAVGLNFASAKDMLGVFTHMDDAEKKTLRK
jgi:hypothetical protein